MNSPTLKTRNFLINNHIRKWKQSNAFSVRLGCVLSSCLSAASFLGAFCLRVARISTMIHRVLAGLARAIPASIPMAKSTITNNRIYAGLFMVSIVAPLSACVHMFLDKDAEIVGWYYFSNFYLYLVLGPYFFCLSIITAAFLWIPPASKRIKFSRKGISFQLTRLLSIPFGLITGKIIWLFQVTSHEEFHRLPSLLSVCGGLVIGYAVIRLLDYLVWRQEHVMNALIDSLEGLYNIPSMDNQKRNELAKPYWQELRKFHSKY